MPVLGIQLEPDIDIITTLLSNAVDDPNKAKRMIASKNKKNWRHRINIGAQYNLYRQTLEMSSNRSPHVGWTPWEHQSHGTSHRTQTKLETDLSTSVNKTKSTKCSAKELSSRPVVNGDLPLFLLLGKMERYYSVSTIEN